MERVATSQYSTPPPWTALCLCIGGESHDFIDFFIRCNTIQPLASTVHRIRSDKGGEAL